MANVEDLILQAEALLSRLERLLPPEISSTDWHASVAFRWQARNERSVLEPIHHIHQISLDDLRGIDRQKAIIEQNTQQFLAGYPANHVLLTGARGTGKSSLVKGLLNRYASQGLRLLEIDKQQLIDLPAVIELISSRPERFLLYCDDLSFEAHEPDYKALKAALDGSVASITDNCLLYATSNRRHLMPEYMSENLEAKRIDDEIHPGESVEEKISLSERFGIWVSFYPFNQDEYLDIVEHWLRHFRVTSIESQRVRQEALQWALARGSRSGRVAWQFARDLAGRRRMPTK